MPKNAHLAKEIRHKEIKKRAMNAAEHIKKNHVDKDKAHGWHSEYATDSEEMIKADREEIPLFKTAGQEKDTSGNSKRQWNEKHATQSEADVKADRNEIPKKSFK